MCECSAFFSTIQVKVGDLLDIIFKPITTRFINTSEYRGILNSYNIEKHTFYDLCAMANRVISVNYDKINIVDLLYFVAIDAKSSFVNASIQQERERKAKTASVMKGKKLGI